MLHGACVFLVFHCCIWLMLGTSPLLLFLSGSTKRWAVVAEGARGARSAVDTCAPTLASAVAVAIAVGYPLRCPCGGAPLYVSGVWAFTRTMMLCWWGCVARDFLVCRQACQQKRYSIRVGVGDRVGLYRMSGENVRQSCIVRTR